MKIRITDFATRHFEGKSGTQIRSHSIKQVEDQLNTIFTNISPLCKGDKTEFNLNIGYGHCGWRLLDGYADFCKLLIVDNFTDAKTGTAKITNENYHWLRTDIVARQEWELPVPTRALHLPLLAEKASYLVFVLYTNEHLKEEHKIRLEEQSKQANEKRISEGKEPLSEASWKSLNSIDGLKYEFEDDNNIEWGVVSIMGQMVNTEEPMHPNTMIRNHMGKEFGGSGSPIDRESYMRSVEFWKNHAIIK